MWCLWLPGAFEKVKTNDITDLAQYRQTKTALMSTMDAVMAASWVSAAKFWNAHSEVTVYLCDCANETVLVFSCKRLDLAQLQTGLEVWEHLVRSFDVVADPSMTFDEVHVSQTADLVLHALAGTETLVLPGQKQTPPSESRQHYVVLIDRTHFNGPVGVQKVADPAYLLRPMQIEAVTQEILVDAANQS
jgi:hypothetical protein